MESGAGNSVGICAPRVEEGRGRENDDRNRGDQQVRNGWPRGGSNRYPFLCYLSYVPNAQFVRHGVRVHQVQRQGIYVFCIFRCVCVSVSVFVSELL